MFVLLTLIFNAHTSPHAEKPGSFSRGMNQLHWAMRMDPSNWLRSQQPGGAPIEDKNSGIGWMPGSLRRVVSN